MTGQIVSHYRILEDLGDGGTGVVFKGEDIRLHRFVRLDILPETVDQEWPGSRAKSTDAGRRYRPSASEASEEAHDYLKAEAIWPFPSGTEARSRRHAGLVGPRIARVG